MLRSFLKDLLHVFMRDRGLSLTVLFIRLYIYISLWGDFTKSFKFSEEVRIIFFCVDFEGADGFVSLGLSLLVDRSDFVEL